MIIALVPTPADLPDDITALKRIIAEMSRDAVTAQTEIAKLKFQLARYRRAEFGRSSEKLVRESEQLELAIETLETDQAERLATAAPEAAAIIDSAIAAQKPARRPLPDHLPREEVRHRADPTCPSCGGHTAAHWRGRERNPRLRARSLQGGRFAPDHRRRERQQRSKPIAAALAQWADDTVRKLSRKSELAAAFRYMRARAASPSAAVLMTAAWHSTTTRPSAPCAVSQSAAKMISLSAPMPAATVPLRCTR